MALKYLPFLPLHYNCSCLTWSNMGLVGIEVLSLKKFCPSRSFELQVQVEKV